MTTDNYSMVKFVIGDKERCNQFVSLFSCMKQFADTYSFAFAPDGVSLEGMDPSHVCMFQLKLSSDWFMEYSVEKPTNISVSSSSLQRVLQTHDGQKIVLSHDDSSDHVDVAFVVGPTDNKGVFAKAFKLALMTVVDHMDLSVPEFEYTAEMSMPSKTLAQLIDQLGSFADTVSVACSEESISLESKGDDTSMNVEIQFDQLTSYEIDEDETVSVCFAVSFLKKVAGAQKLSDSVSVKFSNAYPLFVRYDLEESSALSFHLAPKIEDE